MKITKKHLSLRKEPNQNRSQETMENIVKATAHILEKEGFENTSTNKIAAKAGVSIGSLYQYFSTKESILVLMMENYVKGQLEVIDKALREKQSHNLKETIRNLIEAVLESKRKNRRFTKIFAQKIFSFNKVDLLKRMDDHTMDLFRNHIAPYESQLRMENLEMSLYMTLQCVKVIPVSLMFHDTYDLDDPRILDEMVHLVYQYLKK